MKDIFEFATGEGNRSFGRRCVGLCAARGSAGAREQNDEARMRNVEGMTKLEWDDELRVKAFFVIQPFGIHSSFDIRASSLFPS